MPDDSNYKPGQVIRFLADGANFGKGILLEEDKGGWLVMLVPDDHHSAADVICGQPQFIKGLEIHSVVETLPADEFARIVKEVALKWSRLYAKLAHSSETHWIGGGEAFDISQPAAL